MRESYLLTSKSVTALQLCNKLTMSLEIFYMKVNRSKTYCMYYWCNMTEYRRLTADCKFVMKYFVCWCADCHFSQGLHGPYPNIFQSLQVKDLTYKKMVNMVVKIYSVNRYVPDWTIMRFKVLKIHVSITKCPHLWKTLKTHIILSNMK